MRWELWAVPFGLATIACGDAFHAELSNAGKGGASVGLADARLDASSNRVEAPLPVGDSSKSVEPGVDGGEATCDSSDRCRPPRDGRAPVTPKTPGLCDGGAADCGAAAAADAGCDITGACASAPDGAPATGAWAPCLRDADCVGGRVCTKALQEPFTPGRIGGCTLPCAAVASCVDPPLPGTEVVSCSFFLCVVECPTGKCPEGFECSEEIRGFGTCVSTTPAP